MILSPTKFSLIEIFGNYFYSLLVSVMTLFQSYLREKAIRENYQHLQILQEDTMTSQLLLENMLPQPAHHAKQLLLGELVFDELHDVTLLYSDIKGFTPLSANMDSQVLTKLLNLIYSAFDRHLEHFGLYKVG
jgi:class 3 adenylate cyclase